ncbi:hemin uptake protein HemP [Paraburkholderia sp. BCC1886]|uniref:hemin uptake protein HemP n=1 Tax=Paraburkholderia sp. BCC1886 TaxID=2562670 RepID=UPI0011841C79|nr:hemin uptake protein HemP [Paraburkholderia sp. BCC1886]
MTDLSRASTLSLRRPAAALTSRPKASAISASTNTAGVAPAAKPAADRAGGNAVSADRVVRSDALLQGHSHVSIMHNGETYQLRATRLGKLILTK